ncbi:MAG: hypothetical protein EON54_01350 [Alcaligenaceae bacterium]|nr:MAG: hypothetical protein EON54_01350 [Alcaligenaceae bacterium]
MKPEYKQIMYINTYANRPAVADDDQLMFVRDTKATFYFDKSVNSWMPSARFVIKKSNVVVDGKTAGSTMIYKLEDSSLNFYPTQVIIRAVDISGVTVKPTISIGTNATNYDNIASGTLLNTVTSLLGVTSQPQNVSTSPALASGTQIYVKISGLPVATSYTFKVDVAGYYESN